MYLFITAQNVHRDRINELGSRRFAADHGLKLISFYSKDTWPEVQEVKV